MSKSWAGTTGKVRLRVWPSRASRFFCVSGFTLVEVVLAMAFLGLVVVSMSTILADSLKRHSQNGQDWSLLLAAQRTLEDEVLRLSSSRSLFEKQVKRPNTRRRLRSGNQEVTVVCRRVSTHLLDVRVTARGSGKRVELGTLVGGRWVPGSVSEGR